MNLPLRSLASMKLLTRFGIDQGLRPEECLSGTELDEAQLDDPDAEVSSELELRVIRNLVSGSRHRPGIGLLAGRGYRLSSFGIWGFAMLSSLTLREASKIGLRYLGLTYVFHDLILEEHGDEAHLLLVPHSLPDELKPFVLERDLAGMLQVQRELLGNDPTLLRIDLSIPEPDDLSLYQRELGMRPHFDQLENRVVFPRKSLDLPLAGANPQAARICEEQCQRLLAKRSLRGGLPGQVRNLILECPGQLPGMEQVAAKLHMSSRTLRRQLDAEGITFRQLLEEVRIALAEEMLTAGGLTLEEIAERLGYSEVSNFFHAFARWKGVTPRQFQRGLK